MNLRKVPIMYRTDQASGHSHLMKDFLCQQEKKMILKNEIHF